MDTSPVMPLWLILYVLIPAAGTALVALCGVAWWQFLCWRRTRDTYEARMAAARKMLAHWEHQAQNGRTLMMDR
jgi:hypothetical protein